MTDVGCDACEKMMQPYLDRALNEIEHLEAEEHLERCSYCRKR
jgi:predicted anti-sigma-YlaC factor YlaD